MKIAIIGVGLLGGSIALKIKQLYKKCYIMGCDISEKHLKQAMSLGMIDAVVNLEKITKKKPNFIFLSTPVKTIIKLLPKLLDKIDEQTILIDVGSIKKDICDCLIGHKQRGNFVALHPLAGTQESGPEASEGQIFENKICIICQADKSHPELLNKTVDFCQMLGMQCIFIDDASQHDKITAYVSHLSHIISFALSNTLSKKNIQEGYNLLDWAGSGLYSMLRLSGSNAQMWSDIFETNTENILEAIDLYIKELNLLKRHIVMKNQASIKEYILESNKIFSFLNQKNNTGNSKINEKYIE